MKRVLAIGTASALLLALAACGQDEPDYEAVCVDAQTYEMFNEDDQCDPEDDDYAGLGVWYFVSADYHRKHKSTFKPGHRIAGGTTKAPQGAKVRQAGSKKVTVFKTQAGSPIKNNQDANKIKSGDSNRKPASKSFGSTSKRK